MAYSKPADLDAAFHKKLHRAAQSIMTAAAGKRCGDCKHALLSPEGAGDCLLRVNIDGDPLKINTFGAYACDKHENRL